MISNHSKTIKVVVLYHKGMHSTGIIVLEYGTISSRLIKLMKQAGVVYNINYSKTKLNHSVWLTIPNFCVLVC